ncbi:MAG: galactoside O-acetyltransferase [Muribaculaceae bacterium]|nr:galactoside O-acetyltransferase [Muribaculaceae bacterium]
MKEIRIDVTKQTREELALAETHAQLVFKFNHTLPGTPESKDLMHRIFPSIGEGSRVEIPLTAVRPHNVRIGRNVVIMPGCLMMAAGGITVDDGAMIAANVQLISNNHDLYERQVITCKPVHIGKNAWIGAGATILPGVTVGDNAVVGAASVVTKDVEADTIVAGNPARLIKRIPPKN